MNNFILNTIMFLLVVCFFIYILYFYKKKDTISFVDKVKKGKTLIHILVFIVVIAFLALIWQFFTLILILATQFSMESLLISLIVIIPAAIIFYFFFKIYKNYITIVHNFEKEEIFIKENEEALKNISNLLYKILIFEGVMYICVYICFYTILDAEMLATVDMGFGSSTLLYLIGHFALCLIIDVFTEVFKKAVEQNETI